MTEKHPMPSVVSLLVLLICASSVAAGGNNYAIAPQMGNYGGYVTAPPYASLPAYVAPSTYAAPPTYSAPSSYAVPPVSSYAVPSGGYVQAPVISPYRGYSVASQNSYATALPPPPPPSAYPQAPSYPIRPIGYARPPPMVPQPLPYAIAPVGYVSAPAVLPKYPVAAPSYPIGYTQSFPSSAYASAPIAANYGNRYSTPYRLRTHRRV